MRRAITFTAIFVAATTVATGCGHADRAPAHKAAAVTSSVAAPSPSPSATTPHFTAQISPVTPGSLKHSWHSGCPVPISGLRSIAMSYWGMDHQPHTGQLIVNSSAATKVVTVFHRLWDARFPIRLMQPVDAYNGSDDASVDADNTSAFNCRNATGGSSWSQHAYGLAIDINPCENPYVDSSGTISHPKCVKYGDRTRHDPGLIHKGDVVYRAFTSIGWGWGGNWTGLKDYQHFSSNGH